jgi:hypothetical protein
MICKSKKALSTVFYVPNDYHGRRFLWLLKFYMNRGHFRMRVQGRNENRKQFKAQYPQIRREVPREFASYFAVYLDNPAANEIIRKEWLDVYNQVEIARGEVRMLLREIDALRTGKGWPKETAARSIERQLDALLISLRPKRAIDVN